MTILNNTSIDFDSLVAELESDLQTRETFKALFPGETSKVFTEHGAAVTALMLFHIHSATQNSFMSSAFSKASVYALASSLGNPPTRKLGATVTLSVTVENALAASITLPKFSRFSGRGLEWYTTEDVIIPAGAAGQIISLDVRQGERITESFQSTGKDFQRIVIGENFNVDDQFLTVTVDGTLYTNNGNSLLDAETGAEVYAEQTTSNGRVLVLFGNSIIGSVPTLGVTIEISYANTVGLDSNSSITNDSFQYLSDFDLGGGVFLQMAGVSTTTSAGGAEEQSVDVVKATSPRLFAANKRAVRRDDYEGHIIDFTGASAAKAWGEYEEALQRGFASLEMMNRAFITSVPTTLNRLDNIFATGNGVTTSFSVNSGLTNLIAGSVIITGDSSNEIFYDLDGRGILLSDNISFDEVTGSGSSTANDNAAQAPLAFNNNLTNAYSSTTLPTAFNPIRISYDFGAGDLQQIKSVRIAASNDASVNARAFPRQVKVLASTLASPDITNTDDWVVIRGNVILEDPGASVYSRWLPVDNKDDTTQYRHIALEIIASNGTGTNTQIADVQVQNETQLSSINYETGDVVLNYQTTPPNGDISISGTTGNLSSAEKTDLLNYLNDLNHFTTIIEYRDPIARLVEVIANVYYLDGFDPVTILSEVNSAIDNLFATKTDSLSKCLKVSDIYNAIQSVSGVDYTLLENPTTSLFLEINEWTVLLDKTINVFPTDR